MAGIPWSDGEETILTELITAGCMPREISQVFVGRTYASICSKLQSMGLTVQPPVPEIDMEAYRLLTGKAAPVEI